MASLLPSKAGAQSPPPEGSVLVDFSYQAQPECIEEERAFALVRQRSSRVQRANGDPNSQRLVMEVVRDGTGYRGTLVVVRPGYAEERRSMKGAKCDEVVEALALTAALSIDPNATLTLGPAVLEETTPRPAGEPSGDPPPVPQTAPSESRPSGDEQRARPSDQPTEAQLRVLWGATLDVRKLMKHTAHLGVGSTVALSRASPRVFLPMEMRFALHFLTEPRPPVEGLLSRFVLLRLAYCAVRFGGDLSMMFCPATELGLLWAASRGLSDGQDSLRFFATMGIDAVLRARIAQRVEIWVAPTVGVPLTKRRFVVEPGPEEISSSVDVTWGGSTGIGWVF